MRYDFDRIVNRKGTNCVKYDFCAESGKPENVLPLWVADMDFQTAQPILDRLHQAVSHGIFGYSDGKEGYFLAVANWYQKHFHWEVKRSWLIKTPGVVYALALAIRAFTREGDGVLLQKPVYYPFSDIITDNHRRIVNNPLKLVNGHYEIDFEDFEEKIITEHIKLFLLCSPHNPVGRVWKKWELRKIGEICLKHGVIVVSDEIHADFTYPDVEQIVFAGLDERFADITITCTAPSKTFNLAGLQVSNIFISNRELRRKIKEEMAATGYSQVNALGLAACQTAYEEGEEWLLQVKAYIYENLLFVKDFLEKRLPQIQLIWPEGTYLIWLDCRGLGLQEKERKDLIVNKAKLWLDNGEMFGSEGEGFERINIACPRAILRQALEQLENAIRTTGAL